MKKIPVKCPDCDNVFKTAKAQDQEAQCGNCGTRFIVKRNVLKV